jgi:hypothetical protein
MSGLPRLELPQPSPSDQEFSFMIGAGFFTVPARFREPHDELSPLAPEAQSAPDKPDGAVPDRGPGPHEHT